MTVKAKGRPSTTVIDLDGSQGNAFVLSWDTQIRP